ncbi:MAG: hypothetical protein AAB091_00905 [Elusimicrobiota bacterium]
MTKTSQAGILQEILRRINAPGNGRASVALFDVDDTILSTSWRHLRILKEFAADRARESRHPSELKKLSAITAQETRYYIVDTARQAGVADDSLLQELKNFWFERFFKSEYLSEDRPIAGAPAFCRKVRKIGARIVYQTGRDETMRQATIKSLEAHGFPLPDDASVHLIVKPRFSDPDLEFKTRSIREVGALGRVTAAFENEPAHINLYHDHFPDGLMALLETRCSDQTARPKPEIRRIKNFLLTRAMGYNKLNASNIST